MRTPVLDLTFPHHWQVQILAARPLILPSRHFVYPREAEEVERGALELMIHPSDRPEDSFADNFADKFADSFAETGSLGSSLNPPTAASLPFLATCALGFRDPAAPTGVWSAPDPKVLCAVSGGYAYLIDTTAPERFTMIAYRPVMAVVPAASVGLLLFVGHHSILAWDGNGQAWESDKLSDEGITVEAVDNSFLHGRAWHLMTDQETPFALDLRSGRLAG